MAGKLWSIPKTELLHEAHGGPSLPTTVNTNKSSYPVSGFSFQFWKRTNTTNTPHERRQHSQTPQEIINPPARRHQRLLHSTAGRRASAALVSIFVGTTMLTYMIPLFSAKLRTIESELAVRNSLSESSVSSQSFLHSTFGTSTAKGIHTGRRLASTESLQFKDEVWRNYPLRVLERVRHGVSSMKLIFSLLKNKDRPTNAPITFFGPQLAYISPLTALPKPNEIDDSYTTVISVYHVRNTIPEIPPSHPALGIRSNKMPQSAQPVMEKTRISPMPPGIAQGIATHHPTPRHPQPSAPRLDPLSSVSNELPINRIRPAGLKKRQENSSSVNSGKGLNETPSISTPNKRISKSDGPKISKPVSHHNEKKPTQSKWEESKPRQATEASPQDMIEIWMLHSGNSLCRIYNVARLPGGTLVLPEWMEKHSLVLLHQCGVKDPIYAIKSNSRNDKKFVFDKKSLNMTGRIRIIDNSNMDLIGVNAPRHHMPHFVSDILFPLRAAELFKGSGNGIAKLSALQTNSSPNSPEFTSSAFASLKPSLFLRTETWQASSSTWVQRLAKFFSHPAVGFTLLSEEEKRKTKQRVPYDKSNAIWRFRSVLSDNLDMYGGEGLFDTSGNNFVFSRNGLSGAPAWTIKGISQEPCRVSVTALTRTGPRALLHLDVLKKVTTSLFASGGLVLDFRVVTFDNAGFEMQVKTIRGTNVLIATHGAGNTNVIFMRRGATVIEVFPFAYRAGPFDGLARIFGLEYKAAMSSPQTKVFKECMEKHETKDSIREQVLGWWDKAVTEEKVSPWVHRLELEKEFGEPGKSEGMATRRCVRMQQLAFDTETVAAMAFESAKRQCNDFRFRSKSVHLG